MSELIKIHQRHPSRNPIRECGALELEPRREDRWVTLEDMDSIKDSAMWR